MSAAPKSPGTRTLPGLEVAQLEEKLADFRIEHLIGQGPRSSVYEATQVALGRRVAVKVFAPAVSSDERFRARFERQTRLQAALEDPRFVNLYSAGEAAGCLYQAMQLVHGPTLADARERLRHDPERALRTLAALAAAVDLAASAGLLEAGIVAADILIPAPERPMIADFGLARPMGSGEAPALSGFEALMLSCFSTVEQRRIDAVLTPAGTGGRDSPAPRSATHLVEFAAAALGVELGIDLARSRGADRAGPGWRRRGLRIAAGTVAVAAAAIIGASLLGGKAAEPRTATKTAGEPAPAARVPIEERTVINGAAAASAARGRSTNVVEYAPKRGRSLAVVRLAGDYFLDLFEGRRRLSRAQLADAVRTRELILSGPGANETGAVWVNWLEQGKGSITYQLRVDGDRLVYVR